MRRSSIIMLIAALLLGMVAVLFARTFLGSSDKSGSGGRVALRTVPTVVASADINFGEKLAPNKLKVVQLPADTLPAGSFQRVEELTSGEGRAAMRPIGANEILTQTSLATGASRLSTAPLLNPQMRAIAVPVSEIAGVGGLLYPGDRVDVFFTRQPEEALPYVELLMQDVRVLAVGLDMNVGKDKPGVVRSATLEVSPLQAQKITLATSVGQLSLALRHFSDEARVRLQTGQLMDLNDGTVTRLVRKPGTGAAAPAAGGAPGPGAPPPPKGVTVIRGATTTFQPVIGP
ncbi:Flp pilus assembly protein CpaB [Sandarakinorhabdus sp.]|uniref:Flp pilus assembly protein CpaB n=1 Tax=Sandarakinorhabdus sp. TaxID=1916663 RepID=UPI003F720A83